MCLAQQFVKELRRVVSLLVLDDQQLNALRLNKFTHTQKIKFHKQWSGSSQKTKIAEQDSAAKYNRTDQTSNLNGKILDVLQQVKLIET